MCKWKEKKQIIVVTISHFISRYKKCYGGIRNKCYAAHFENTFLLPTYLNHCSGKVYFPCCMNTHYNSTAANYQFGMYYIILRNRTINGFYLLLLRSTSQLNLTKFRKCGPNTFKYMTKPAYLNYAIQKPSDSTSSDTIQRIVSVMRFFPSWHLKNVINLFRR